MLAARHDDDDEVKTERILNEMILQIFINKTIKKKLKKEFFQQCRRLKLQLLKKKRRDVDIDFYTSFLFIVIF